MVIGEHPTQNMIVIGMADAGNFTTKKSTSCNNFQNKAHRRRLLGVRFLVVAGNSLLVNFSYSTDGRTTSDEQFSN